MKSKLIKANERIEIEPSLILNLNKSWIGNLFCNTLCSFLLFLYFDQAFWKQNLDQILYCTFFYLDCNAEEMSKIRKLFRSERKLNKAKNWSIVRLIVDRFFWKQNLYFSKTLKFLKVQCPPLNRITLGQHKSDSNNRMIQLAYVFCVLFWYNGTSNIWLQ